MSSSPPDAVTVACGAGFAGDRIEPAVDAARSGLVDTVVLECLAERTLVGGLQARRRDPAAGYDTRLRRRLTPLLPAARATGTRVVSNLGSANPAAAAEEVARLARELGLTGLWVAAVLGDDVAASTDRVSWSGEHPTDPDSWLGVHAYLGMEPIAQALAEGADVVLTGRVADSALFSAPVAARHDLDAAGIAAATTIGHLLECSGQLTGGNLADLRRPPRPRPPTPTSASPSPRSPPTGRPRSGCCPAKPARLDAIGCTLQLLYEVHDPRAYLTPDTTLDFSGVRFEEVGENRMRVTGAVGRPRPRTAQGGGLPAGVRDGRRHGDPRMRGRAVSPAPAPRWRR